MKTFFSLILPIYNVEKYIEQCLDSILSQSFKDFEIICVDDGSPDNSAEICKKYALKDSRIKLIQKENEGVSVARNTGILASSGEYLWFVDPDDYIEKDALQQIFEKAHSEMIFINAWSVSHKIENLNFVINKDENIFKQFQEKNLKGFAWYKIVKRDFVIENNLFFTKGLTYAEDLDWTLEAFKHLKTFEYIKNPLYYYRISRVGSATNKYNIKNFKSILEICQRHKDDNSYVELIMARLFHFAIFDYSTVLSKKHQKQYKKDIKNLLYLENLYDNPTAKRFYKMYKFLGFTLAPKVYKLTLLNKHPQ